MRQIVKFVIVGLIATIIDISAYYIFYSIFNINPLLANVLAFCISVTYNYIASVKWVFDITENKSNKRMFAEFIVLSIVGLLLTELIIYIAVDKLNINAMIIKIIATGIVMVFNFITRKIFLEKG